MWEIVAGGETTPPENVEAFRKWKIKAGNAMFTVETSVEEEMVEHIKRVCKHSEGSMGHLCDTIFKEIDVRLQLLENELMSVVQQDMTIT